jgi:miniconductance mechanosensitive channel
MIPTYSFISESFQNWRSMLEAGGRRLRRSILIDLQSVRKVDDGLIEKTRNFSIPNQIITSNTGNQTNLGLFRWYLIDYLTNHPAVNQQMSILVRLQPSLENGIPLEFTVFSVIESLNEYENFQSGLMEHILTTLPQFDLKVYQRP